MSNYVFSVDIKKEEYEQFVQKHEYCNLLQSYDWANIKGAWGHLHTGVYENGELIATALVLIRHLPMKFTMFYIPRGPIMDYANIELVEFFLNELKQVSKQYHCLFIKFDPGFLVSSSYLNEERNEIEHKTFLNNLTKCGAHFYGYTQELSDTVQPRYHMVEYQEDFSMDQLTKKGKKNIKTAMKQNLDICFGHLELLDDFAKVMKCTENRKGIALRDKEYYQTLLETYQDDAFITLAYFPIVKMLEACKEQYMLCEQELVQCPENAKKKRFTLEEKLSSLSNKIKSYSEYANQYGDKVCVCGTLTVKYGKTSEILYAGMNEDFKRLMGPYLTWYQTMEKCFEMGCTTSNMGGIEGSLQGGLVDFKEVFHPRINEFIGEFDLPVNKVLYSASQYAYKLRKCMRKH